MKKGLMALLLVVFLAGLVLAGSPAPKDPYDFQVKSLYSQPDPASSLIYIIPIEVKLLDISADANWYKVRIHFALGPISYTFIGWTEIPVGSILIERLKGPVKENEE